VNSVSEKTSFIDRVARMMERVEYRRADTAEDKVAIFRMRHEAYTRDGKVAVRASGMFNDALDESPNAWLIGVFIDGELASSVRLHVSASSEAPLPARAVFSEVLDPRLEVGECLIDITRHVNRLEFTRQFPQMPYITVRPAFLAEEYFDAHHIVAAMRIEHQGAFRRMFNMLPWAPPTEYPMLKRLMPLLAYDCRTSRAKTHARYPFYRSSPPERLRLFGKSSNGFEDSRLAILGKRPLLSRDPEIGGRERPRVSQTPLEAREIPAHDCVSPA
jgi:hypothetical protein